MSDLLSTKPERTIDKNLLDACIHCGLCLPACPTYLATGRETESPRGRIYLLNLWQTGAQELTPRLAEHIESCLGCLGCQTACPSGVQYGAILNQFRPELAKTRSKLRRALERFCFAKILPDDRSLLSLAKLLRLWQRFKGKRLLSRLSQIVPLPLLDRLVNLESYLPNIPAFVPLARQSWSVGKKEGTLQFFKGCVMDVLYGPVNHAAVRVLCAQRQIVEVPEQTCCGALAFHSGESDITINLAKRNITSFENRQGPIIVTSAGCSAMLKEYDGLFAQGDEFRKRAKAFSARVMDVSEFVSAHPLPETIRQRARALFPTVAYHAACHLAHAQNVRTAPEQLLRQVVDDVNSGHADAQVPAMRLMPLLDKEHCCGSAGIFNILHPELSDKVLEAKMQKLEESGAKIVITSNPGCLLQLELGIKRQALPMRVMHLIELLDQVYGLGGQDD